MFDLTFNLLFFYILDTDGDWLRLDASIKRDRIKTLSTFTINPIEEEDEGDYRCIASNEMANDLMKKIHLWIKGEC